MVDLDQTNPLTEKRLPGVPPLTASCKPMPPHQYFAHEGLSYSLLKSFSAQTPYHFYASQIAPGRSPKPTTEAMIFGSAFHTMILEPQEFDKIYAKAPTARKNSKAWNEQAAADKILLKESSSDDLKAMRESVQRHPLLNQLLQGGVAEEAIFWEEDGTKFKAKLDYRVPAEKFIIDLKTCRDGSPEAFAKDVLSRKYHWQAYLYAHAAKLLTGDDYAFIFAAIEKDPPFAIGLYTLDDRDLRLAAEEVNRVVTRYLECQRSGIWPDYGAQISTLTLPKYRRVA